MSVQALVTAHQNDAQAVNVSFQVSATQIEEVNKALLMFKETLMDEAKSGHDRAREDMRLCFDEEYNVTKAMMQSKIQDLRTALADCNAHDIHLNGDRAKVGLGDSIDS